MSLLNRLIRFGFSFILLLPTLALGDAIVRTNAMFATTIAEIYISEEEVLVDLEVGLNDLESFANLVPDQIYTEMGNEPMPLAERARRFFAEDFLLIVDGADTPLMGGILSMGPGTADSARCDNR